MQIYIYIGKYVESGKIFGGQFLRILSKEKEGLRLVEDISKGTHTHHLKSLGFVCCCFCLALHLGKLP